MKKGTQTYVVTMPFGQNFQFHWDLWKQYKKEQFHFHYRSAISEQSALGKLVRISGGLEEAAIAILQQSRENGWQGLFELKNIMNGKQQTGAQGGDLRGQVNSLYTQRFGKSG